MVPTRAYLCPTSQSLVPSLTQREHVRVSAGVLVPGSTRGRRPTGPDGRPQPPGCPHSVSGPKGTPVSRDPPLPTKGSGVVSGPLSQYPADRHDPPSTHETQVN